VYVFPSSEADFITDYELEEKSNTQILLILTYYAFTTFSTVGFGDYHPVSSSERLMCIVFMLLGVIITTTSIDNLKTMVDQIRQLKSSYEESE